MQRPLRSPPRRDIYIKKTSCSLGFMIGISIGATILVAYYSRFIKLF